MCFGETGDIRLALVLFWRRQIYICISSLNVDSTSSVTFTEPLKAKIPNLTVNSGELLLIDMDCVIMDEVRIANGGEMRII